MPPRVPLSVVLITFNAGQQLAACLESVSFAEDIVVVDSASTDDTVEIAVRYRARVLQHEWQGFGPQKNFAVRQARYDWVLCIDADERVSPELALAIQTELSTLQYHAYRLVRCNRFMGRWLRHGEGYPDWTLRLFNRQYAQWSDDTVHEKVLYQGEIGKLHGDLLHDSADSLDAYLAKQHRYTTLQAQTLYIEGKKASALHLLLSPLLRFIKFYVVRLGFLDGIAGLVHIAIGCTNSFHKYAKLLALQRQEK